MLASNFYIFNSRYLICQKNFYYFTFYVILNSIFRVNVLQDIVRNLYMNLIIKYKPLKQDYHLLRIFRKWKSLSYDKIEKYSNLKQVFYYGIFYEIKTRIRYYMISVERFRIGTIRWKFQEFLCVLFLLNWSNAKKECLPKWTFVIWIIFSSYAHAMFFIWWECKIFYLYVTNLGCSYVSCSIQKIQARSSAQYMESVSTRVRWL